MAEIIDQYAAGEDIHPTATRHPAVLAAVQAQGALGNWEDFFRGYIVKEWKEAFHRTHTNDADQQFDQFQQMIWFDIAWPQWMERNRVAKGQGSNADQVESERLTKQLVWYHKHRHELLPIHQRPLARKKLHEVLRMRPATRRAWIHHLEVATESWERNKYLTTPGQRTLLDYFPGSAPPRPPPRNITREARTQADIGVLRLEHDQVRIDHVLNPVE